ncbi:MAG TPA: hypothetical protein VH062_36810 [Polyangiaceae bacterium]|jgi:hypothetical protein|nr:hypothetical protein [Polyangiaceae bacterium]
MSKTNAVKYAPRAQEPQRTAYPSYLVPVPSAPAEGVGEEALTVTRQLEELSARINQTETLTRALLARLEEDEALAPYNHVQGRQIGMIKVRYKNLGRLPPREVSYDDE